MVLPELGRLLIHHAKKKAGESFRRVTQRPPLEYERRADNATIAISLVGVLDAIANAVDAPGVLLGIPHTPTNTLAEWGTTGAIALLAIVTRTGIRRYGALRG